MLSQNTALEDIGAVIGFSATVALSEWFGGSWVYVPQTAEGEHDIAKVIGASAFRGLVSLYGGERVYIPLYDANAVSLRNARKIQKAILAGGSVTGLARDIGMSRRNVQHIRRKLENAGLLPVVLKGRSADQP